MVISGELSEGHARTLISIESKENQLKAVELIIENSLNVRQTEELVKKINSGKFEKKKKEDEDTDEDSNYFVEVRKIQNDLKNALGTKVKLVDNKGKGKIVIDYYSADERERLIKYLLENK